MQAASAIYALDRIKFCELQSHGGHLVDFGQVTAKRATPFYFGGQARKIGAA
jgi:hypothetical protein